MPWRAAMPTNCARRPWKPWLVLGPQLIVQEDPHCVEPVRPGHAQLGVDAPGVVGARLEHLELIDGV